MPTYDLRRKIYQELINSAEVTHLVDDRVFQANAFTTPPKEKPFLVYRMGVEIVHTAYVLGARETTFQVWVHDDPGDYFRIDEVQNAARKALLTASRDKGFLEFRFFENGEDFNDPELGTILRFARYTAVTLPF